LKNNNNDKQLPISNSTADFLIFTRQNGEDSICLINNMKPFLTLILTLAFSLQVFATPQAPDILIYKGDTLRIYGEPLEKHPNIDSLRIKMFGKKDYWCATSCYRSYIAEWKIVDNQLYLMKISHCCKDDIKFDLKFLFGEKYVNGKVKADRVTGNFTSQQGKKLLYNHDMYEGWISEYELELHFEKRKVTDTKLYDNRKAKQSKYSQNDQKLQEYIYSNINWKILPKQDSIVKVWVKFSANEDGIIDSAEVVRGYNKIFDQEAVRVIKLIPEWSIYYRKGKFVRNPKQISIVFNKYNRLEYKK